MLDVKAREESGAHITLLLGLRRVVISLEIGIFVPPAIAESLGVTHLVAGACDYWIDDDFHRVVAVHDRIRELDRLHQMPLRMRAERREDGWRIVCGKSPASDRRRLVHHGEDADVDRRLNAVRRPKIEREAAA